MTYKKQLRELLYDEEEILQELIIKVKPLLQINKTDGRINFTISSKILTDKQTIILYLIGAQFVYDLDLRDKFEVTNQELIGFTGKTKHTINPRLAELKQESKIKSAVRGFFSVNPKEIIADIDDISTISMKHMNS